MQYRTMGKTGLHLSAFSLGSWVTFKNQVDEKLAVELMAQAYERGVNFFDNAEVYAHGASEEIMGKALSTLNWDRDTYCVSSKVFWGGKKPTQRGLSRKHIHDACHAAIKRLQVEYLDLFFCHRPDQRTPIEETVRAMDVLVKQGKIIYWGTSEWSAQEIMEAHMLAQKYDLTPPSMEQPQYNLFHREKIEQEFRRLYETVGLGTTIWSPLASGLLTGKYNSGIPEGSRANLESMEWLKERIQSPEWKERIEKVKKLDLLARELKMSVTQLALAWCLVSPHVTTVMLGATSAQQLSENMDALEKFEQLTPEVIAKIEEITQNRPSEPEDFFTW